jgi:hypothetical protein
MQQKCSSLSPTSQLFPGFHHFLLYVRSGCQSMVMVRLPMQPFRCVAFRPVAMVDSDVCSRIL